MAVFKPQIMAGLMSRSGFLTVPCSLVPRERYDITHLPLLLPFCLSSLLNVCSSVLAWKIPWTEEPRGLRSVGLQRVRPDSEQLSAHTHNTLNGQSPHTTVSVVFTPPSIPTPSHHGASSTLFPVFMATHELLGKEGWCFSFSESWCFLCISVLTFPSGSAPSPMLVLTGSALLWAFCLHKLGLACYGSVILFWISLWWYSAFCRRKSQAHYVEIMFAA